ncbi:MAG: UPF0175 family protein [Planctomycetes bacterium]|nr:UPF0175 family protein [Planctomycetota bacterium]
MPSKAQRQTMKTIQVEMPDEVMSLVGSAKAVEREAKEALVLNLVRKGTISKARAAELLGLSLWQLPELLARYEIPWFAYGPHELEEDLGRLAAYELRQGKNK